MGYGIWDMATAYSQQRLKHLRDSYGTSVTLPKAITGAISISDPGFLAATVPILAASMTYQCPELGASTKV